MALSLPYRRAMKTTPARPGQLSTSRRRIKTSPAVSLWRPEIVLATSIEASPARRPGMLAEPGARPEALRTQRGATGSRPAAPHADVLVAAQADGRRDAGRAAPVRPGVGDRGRHRLPRAAGRHDPGRGAARAGPGPRDRLRRRPRAPAKVTRPLDSPTGAEGEAGPRPRGLGPFVFSGRVDSPPARPYTPQAK